MLSGMDIVSRPFPDSRSGRCFGETRRLGIPVGVHAEDRDMVRASRPASGRRAAENPWTTPRPGQEPRRSRRWIRCGSCVGKQGPASTSSTWPPAGPWRWSREARDEGLPLSAETCPHYLEFTADDLQAQGALLKTAPVVKSAADRSRLWEGLRSGELEFVATDHAAGTMARREGHGFDLDGLRWRARRGALPSLPLFRGGAEGAG